MALVTSVVVAGGLLAAIFVPAHTASAEIQVSSSGGSVATLATPAGVWVTVHYGHPGNMPMRYWMEGPGGSMMFDHHGMMRGDELSFWSNGGDYHCWAGYSGSWQAMGPVWINATWGLI